MAVRSADLNVMVTAATKGGRSLVRDFGEIENLQVRPKGTADFHAVSRRRAAQTVHRELARARPNFGVQEAGRGGDDSRVRWIFDPLNGSQNFAHGLPHFAITIAVLRHGAISAALTYDPLRDDLYWAERGSGSYLNDRRLRVAARRDPALAVIGTNQSGGQLDGQSFATRQMGCPAMDLAFVASGRLDGYWGRDLAAWDLAAGMLLVREAGGFVTALDGADDPLAGDSILAANNPLHDALGPLIGPG